MFKSIRVEKSIFIVLAGLLLGALMGVFFTFLEESGTNFLATFLGEGKTSSPRVGFAAPDFELLDLSGKPVRLSDLRGSPVIINFWATWCNPCRIEMPLIEATAKENPGIVVLGINADESKRVVQPYVEKIGLTFPILLDPGSKVEDMYQIQGLPTSFFLDKDGVIRAVQIGILSDGKLSENLEKIGIKK